MLNIADAVTDIISKDEIIHESLRYGVLNLSAYAKKIKSVVEEKTKKSVKVGTLVVSLARLRDRIIKEDPIKPSVKISKISIQTDLVELVFEKREETITALHNLDASVFSQQDFFALSQGNYEITLIISREIEEKVRGIFHTKEKAFYQNLVALSIRFTPEYIAIPNVLYALLGVLAVKRINLIEIISTNTELTFILERKNLETAVSAYHTYSS